MVAVLPEASIFSANRTVANLPAAIREERQGLMILSDAQDILQRMLHPMPLDAFLDDVLGKRFIKLEGRLHDGRRDCLLGEDPERVFLDSFARLSPKIGCHAAAPSGPPPAIEALPDAASFRAKIAAFHARGYTVRLPEIRTLTQDLDVFIRALEVILHQPVKVESFWSRGDAKAPVHHDDYDIIVIQLRGRKRWFISMAVSDLQNAWKTAPDGAPRPERFTEVPVEPGDLLYLPRGTTHHVDAITDSIHLSIGFVPLTLREAIIACIDHLSDLSRPFRETVGARIGTQAQTSDFGDLTDRIRAGIADLMTHCGTDAFIVESLQRRSARAIGSLDKLTPPTEHIALSPLTRLRHNRLGVCHTVASASRIDFAYPGGHHFIHRGVEQSVAFIAKTPEFCIRDIPGEIGEDVRMALAEKLVSSGFLQVAAD